MPRSSLLLASLALLAGCVAPPPPASPPVASYAPPAYRPPSAPEPVGYPGAVRNPMVRDVQRQLRRHGFYPGPIDGNATPLLADSIRSFQASHGLTPDGVASPYLLRVLRNTPPGR